MARIDGIYHNLLSTILADGYEYEDPNRKGVIRKEITHTQIEYALPTGFPLLTTKQMYFKGIVGELLWFLRGDTNIKYLNDNNIHIWDKDAAKFSETGDLGRIYGAQWRKWTGEAYFIEDTDSIEHDSIDQIRRLIHILKINPMGTRHIVTAWNPAELHNTALPPCHWAFEIICFPYGNSYGFNLKWHQRSVDVFLGLPFNIASYALLAHIIGHITGYKPWMIIGDLSNIHIYDSHMDAVKEQLMRDTNRYTAPNLIMELPEYNNNFDEFINKVEIKNFGVNPYYYYPQIKAEMLETNK